MQKQEAIKENKIVRFILVGGSATAIDFVLLNVFVLAGFSALLSNIISTTSAMVFSFITNKKYTFKSDSKNYRKEVILFFIFTAISMWLVQGVVINYLPGLLPTSWPEYIQLNVSKIMATVISMICNFLAYELVVFNENNQKRILAIISRKKSII